MNRITCICVCTKSLQMLQMHVKVQIGQIFMKFLKFNFEMEEYFEF